MRTLKIILVFLLCGISSASRLQAGSLQWTPADGFVLAAVDIQTIPLGFRSHIRYFWDWSEPVDYLDTLHRLESYQSHSLNKTSVITPLYLNCQGYHSGLVTPRLVRINLDDFGIDPNVWDKLDKQDPYFHIDEQIDEDAAFGSDGKQYTGDDGRLLYWRGSKQAFARNGQYYQVNGHLLYYKEQAELRKVRALAPILTESENQRKALAVLVAATHSPVPVVSGAWFFFQTAIQKDRNPGYRDFKGFKNLAEFQKNIGFNQGVLDVFHLEFADAVAESSVTVRGKPRAIVGKIKAQGHYFFTLDVDPPTDKSNPLRVLDPDKNLVFAATEQMGLNPCGFWDTALFDANGVAQDVVPQNIAGDYLGPKNDINVHVGTLSCYRCHDHEGLNTIDPYVRNVLNAPPLALGAAKIQENQRLREIYTSDLEHAITDDRAIFARACLQATGLTPDKMRGVVTEGWKKYTESVDADRAARELGVTKAQMIEGFSKFTANTGSIDPVLATYLRPEDKEKLQRVAVGLIDDKRSRPVQIELWLEVYPIAQLTIRQLVPAQLAPVKKE